MFIKLGLLLNHPTQTKAESLQYDGQSYNYTFNERAFTHVLVICSSDLQSGLTIWLQT